MNPASRFLASNRWRFLTALMLLNLYPQMAAFSQSARDLKATDSEYREYMVTLTRQLGVTCTTCHSIKNFADDNKPQFRIAKEHMKITQALIDAGFDGQKSRPKADCYMCHRGQLHPDFREKFDPMIMEKGNKKIQMNNSPSPTTAEPPAEKTTEKSHESP